MSKFGKAEHNLLSSLMNTQIAIESGKCDYATIAENLRVLKSDIDNYAMGNAPKYPGVHLGYHLEFKDMYWVEVPD